MVINESASRALNLKVGDKAKPLRVDSIEFTIRGIVKDFNHTSLHQAVAPLAFLHPKELQSYRFFSFRLTPGNLVESVSALEQKWHDVFPDDPFDYAFMEDRLADLYKSELKLRKASTLGTGIMTVIVIVGLLGMVSLSVSRRIKEIGVRKVLGASVWSILTLFSVEYVKIIIVAVVVAIPLAWYGTDTWLEGFAFRINLSWWLFAVPGAALLTIALTVVLITARRAAVANPVDSLRVE
jgi:putative ABC transport system permease protein